jgi:hypothetical protein
MFAPKVAKAQTKLSENPTSKLAPQRSTPVTRPFDSGVVDQTHMLQRSIGNQATLRYLTQRLSNLTANEPAGHNEQATDLASLTARGTRPGVSWDFSKIPLFPPELASRSQGSSPQPGIIQPKFVVGQANDPLEHEADRVANAVMRMPNPGSSFASTAPQIGRIVSSGEREDKEAQNLQMKPAATSRPQANETPVTLDDVLQSAGQPLDVPTRDYFEPRFGHDFSGVRVHTDGRAAASAVSIGASAYTAGSNIAFAAGRYSPATSSGRRLLAHELVHVLQQSGTPAKATLLQRQGMGESVRGEEGESLPGGPGMERTVPEGTKQPAPPGSREAVRVEAERIGEEWGIAFADKDIQLGILQDRSGGHSVWDTLTPEQKKAHAQRIQDDFARLPVPPEYDKPELISAQEDGFMAGVQSGYSLEQFTVFLVKIGSQLAISIFSGLAARGIKLPRFFANLLQRSLPRLVAPGTGAAFGQQMAEEMLQGGFKGNPFRVFMARLNAAPVRLPPNEAAEAIRVATKTVSGGTMGTMPPIQQGGILVVPSRAPIPNAPVMGIRPDGTVIMGRAPKIDIITQDASGAPIFPPVARITGDIQWE